MAVINGGDVRSHGVDQASQSRTYVIGGGFPVRGEQERAGQRVDHLNRRGDVPALLQPGVPGDTDAGQLGDLFAPEAGGPASPRYDVFRQPHVYRPQPGSPGAQKGTQLGAPRRVSVVVAAFHTAPVDGEPTGRLAVSVPGSAASS